MSIRDQASELFGPEAKEAKVAADRLRVALANAEKHLEQCETKLRFASVVARVVMKTGTEADFHACMAVQIESDERLSRARGKRDKLLRDLEYAQRVDTAFRTLLNWTHGG